jgi:hypothetical protein
MHTERHAKLTSINTLLQENYAPMPQSIVILDILLNRLARKTKAICNLHLHFRKTPTGFCFCVSALRCCVSAGNIRVSDGRNGVSSLAPVSLIQMFIVPDFHSPDLRTASLAGAE